MTALADILAAKSKAPEEVVIVFLLFVAVAIAISALRAVQKRRQMMAGRPQRRRIPHYPPQPAPRFSPPSPLRQAPPLRPVGPLDSASYTSVAQQLVPEMLAPVGASAEPAKAAPKFSMASLLKSRNDVRRALVLSEVLSRPLALRRGVRQFK